MTCEWAFEPRSRELYIKWQSENQSHICLTLPPHLSFVLFPHVEEANPEEVSNSISLVPPVELCDLCKQQF